MIAKSKIYPLLSKLSTVKVEKDVENTYRECFSQYFGTDSVSITSPYGCDGYLTLKRSDLLFDIPDVGYSKSSIERLKILFEFKFDKNFKDVFDKSQ